MNLLPPLNFIAQKLLYLWIKTDVSRISDPLYKNNNTVVIYTLQSRAWSDLLVLEHECKTLNISKPLSRIKQQALHDWHHVYAVAQAQPLKAWLQQKAKYSSMLSGIYQALLNNPELDVIFVPVIVFWGRPVMKQKHWLHILFSETWGFAGRTHRFFTILFNGKNTLIEYSAPISYRNLINNCEDQKTCVAQLQTLLSERLIEIKTATLGPDISHRRTLVRRLLENQDIKAAIHARSQQQNISIYKATKIAQNYLQEIVADRSYTTIKILQRILNVFWNKFYSGVDIHFNEPLKQLALSHELVYVPCHRSHIDYLLLSFVIHHEGLAIPCIAAGKNLNMPLIGPVLRKAGAFFIRRSFKGNALYSTVMFEYLASLLSSAMPIEYFVEGGRSRTGRLLQPKPGMIAMTIRAYLKYQQRPIAFIPVYIGYEKMIEGKAYLAELKGDDKKSESLFGSVRSIFQIRGNYGRISASFGQAVLLDEVLQQHCSNWKQQVFNETQRPPWLRACVNQTGQNIMQNINACCAVNAVNLIAAVLLASPNQTMDETELIRTLDFYVKLIKRLNYSDRISITKQLAAEQIQYVENLGLIHRRKHEMGDFIYLDNAHAVLLTYYRNNILHLLAIPSLIACCFNNMASLKKDNLLRYIKITYPFLRSEFFLPWTGTDIEKVVNDILQTLTDTELLIAEDESLSYRRPQISTENHAQLTTIAGIISPLLELYYMIFALLAEHGSDILSRERLEQQCHLMAQRLSLMYNINSPDFFDKKLIANFINNLIENNYVNINENENLVISDYAVSKGRHARRLLDKNMQYNILQMLHTSTSD